ncbi:hypothetical protein RCL1_003003 [Eukaryota sp. TZLM3-RCL]
MVCHNFSGLTLGSSVPGFATVSHSDISVVPDPDTLRLYTWGGDLLQKFVEFPYSTALAFCHIENPDKSRHSCDPRNILQKVVDKAKEIGYQCVMFSELEFYLLKNGEPVDSGKYLDAPPKDRAGLFRRILADFFTKLGGVVKRIHHECGPGQQELEMQLTPAMWNADCTILGIWACHLISDAMGWDCVFDPKPWMDRAGNGLHMHIMLQDLEGKNVMYSAEDPQKLSKVARQFMAGQLKYASEITAVFAREHSTFDRLRPGFEAPVYKFWDFSNRTSLVRVPHINPDDLPEKQRCEFRAGDASGNPHLLAAAIMYAGIKGIMEELDPVPNFTLNADEMTAEQLAAHGVGLLPRSLAECNEILASSPFIEELLGRRAADFLIAENNKRIHGTTSDCHH